MIEPILLTAVRIVTFKGDQKLTNASGFFFEREQRLFLVTSRHVVFDEPTGHKPDRVEIDVHVDENNVAASTVFSIPLYKDDKREWVQGIDGAGAIDVAVIPIHRPALPATMAYRAFTPAHLLGQEEHVEVGSSLLVVGFPLGFQDKLHRIAVVRQAIIASSFGLRFQGEGYFLTDARTHRGISGAPVVMRAPGRTERMGDLPFLLLGIHSARLDVTRDLVQDEPLALNCAWYADILMTLTLPPPGS